jgi:hypothetical protein
MYKELVSVIVEEKFQRLSKISPHLSHSQADEAEKVGHVLIG